VKKRVAPGAALEAAIEELLSEGLGDSEQLAEVGRLGARLVLQRALEEEVADYLGRAHYERTEEARGSRNGVRPRRLQTAEGELELQMPQPRNTADRFVSQVLPDVRTAIRTRPLEALIKWVAIAISDSGSAGRESVARLSSSPASIASAASLSCVTAALAVAKSSGPATSRSSRVESRIE
jgi:hypothetical protein